MAAYGLGQRVSETYGWTNRETERVVPACLWWVSAPSVALKGAMMTRIAVFVIVALALGLSACTNHYDPV